jgi:hypothetical protein
MSEEKIINPEIIDEISVNETAGNSDSNNINDSGDFTATMHRYGRGWTLCALVLMLLVPVAAAIYFRAVPAWGGLLAAIANVCLIYLPVSIVEVITYAPILGTGATYLAFVTGNLSNLKIPCAMNAREIVGTDFGTKENEIISTLSVAVSSIVTCVILAVGVLLIAPLAPLLGAEVLQPAFNTILPALFGALGYTYFTKSLKVAVLPFVILVIVCLAFPAAGGQVGFLIPISALIAMLWARVLYKKGLA